MLKIKNNKLIKRCIIIASIVLCIIAIVAVGTKVNQNIIDKRNGIGEVLDTYKGVEVYYNGSDYGENHGKHYARDFYYYGYKWQCVEYVKRFYHDALDHKMPDVYGNAKDFFDEKVAQGELNEKRGLIQYKNGEDEKPRTYDMLIFTDTTYGHIVIISEVGEDYIEVVQQNMGRESRDTFDLKCENGKYYIGGKRVPAGWLRKE